MLYCFKVTSRRLAGCAARLEQTASLPCATHHTLRAFWTSCRVRGIDQSILKATLIKYHRRHQPCLFAGHRAVGEGRLAVCRDGGPKACGQTGLTPTD